MRNLKVQGKKLLSNTWPHILVIICVLVIGYASIIHTVDRVDQENLKYITYQQEQDSILNQYKVKLDSMQTANFLLEKELMGIENKVDSITVEQGKINKAYEEKINIISNATLSEHTSWFYAKLDSLRQYHSTK